MLKVCFENLIGIVFALTRLGEFALNKIFKDFYL